MKIVSPGQTWTKQCGCSNCKTQLEINDNDVRFKQRWNESIWGGGEGWYTDLFYIYCPNCKITLSLSDIPNWVCVKAKNR